MATVRRGRNGGRVSVEFADNKTVQRYTQVWVVELDGGDPDPISDAEVANITGLPRPGRTTFSPRDGLVIPFCICKGVSPKSNSQNRRVFHLEATFELEGAEQQDPEDDQQDPTSLDPRIEPFCDGTEAIMYKDWDGKLVVNPLDEMFTPPVLAPIPLPGVRVTRFVASYDEQTLGHWKFCTNDDEWRGQPVDAWYIREVTGKEVEFGSHTIGQLQFDIVSNPLEMTLPKADGEGDEVRRYGWLDVRATESDYSIVAVGEEAVLKANRIVKGGPPKRTWIDKNGNKSPTPVFEAFRKSRQRDFGLIVSSNA